MGIDVAGKYSLTKELRKNILLAALQGEGGEENQ